MKIGIISDSHKKINLLKEAIERLENDGAEYIVHAGDIVLKESLDLLQNCHIPYKAVIGNNDSQLLEYLSDYNLVQEPYYFKIKDISVKLMHLPYYLNNDSSLIIYGHTHHFEAKENQNTLYINPGEICGRKKSISEFVMVEVKTNKWKVRHYQKDISKDAASYCINTVEFQKGKK